MPRLLLAQKNADSRLSAAVFSFNLSLYTETRLFGWGTRIVSHFHVLDPAGSLPSRKITSCDFYRTTARTLSKAHKQ